MKILYLNTDRGIPVLGDKGASVHVRAFTSAAAALGHEVVLACASLGRGNPEPVARLVHLGSAADEAQFLEECARRQRPRSSLDDAILRRELECLCHDRALPARLLAELSRMAFKPDLVYERHALFHVSGVQIAAELKVPRILEVNAPLIDEQTRYRGLRLIGEAICTESRSYGAATAIVAVSDAVASHIRAVVGATDRLHVIPNGVDFQLFSQMAGAAEMRRRFGLGPGTTIGFVGSFKPWHGIAQLLDVFAVLASDRPDLRLVAVGDGPDLAMVRERADAPPLAGRVLLPGRIPHADIPAWMSVMDLTVAPYLPQPDFYFSPMKIVESLAAGLPVVAPNVGQIPELVCNGETGLLYSPGDAAALADALAALVDDPARRRRMGESARGSATARSWDGVVRRILELVPHGGPELTA